jgi:hypothetical protein
MLKRLTIGLVSLALITTMQTPAGYSAISKSAFQDALSQLEVSQDEFVGNYEIFGNPNTDYWTQDEDGNYFDLSVDLTKKDSKSKWKFVMVSYYSGENWIFHNEMNLKSSKGKLNLKIPSVSRDVDSGNVSETGALTLTNSQISSFCKIMSGNDVTFRLRGNSGSVTGAIQDGSISYNLALCTVYQGLLQGFKPVQ